ncbi:MAG: DUF1287 domain-containing protein [Bacilli bacterium]
MKKSIVIIVILFAIIVILISDKTYRAVDFNITEIKSSFDCDKDNVDDYTDILLGARSDALKRPKYKSAYYSGGYPPSDEGVCTDLIWRAFKEAGYLLKDMVSLDIKNNNDVYKIEVIDDNIDFRRVNNLKIFFDRNSLNLSLDLKDIASFQPGDIVTFKTNHIAIISDKRNASGLPYIIHNAGQYQREDNTFKKWVNKYGLSGHYRMNNTNMCLK